MNCREIQHGSEDFRKTVDLRDRVLRKPLGLSYSEAQLASENKSHHLVLEDAGVFLACLILKPAGKELVKMRQVAVDTAQQGKGFGRQLVDFSEAFAKEKGFKRMELHARESAVPFYNALGYSCIPHKFFEVGIPHFKMYKEL